MSIVGADKPIKRSRDRAEGATLCAASCNFSDASHIFLLLCFTPVLVVRARAGVGLRWGRR
jgi:hypothetical protein